MKFKNEIMLITYADSLGKNLRQLHQALDLHFDGAVSGLHILPFFPSSADRGFAPIRYDMVEPAFGSFDDVTALGRDYYLMFDFMVNHISRSSEYYQDFQRNRDHSRYKDFFIRYKDFWPGGEPTSQQVDKIYKRKPKAPYAEIEFADGSTEKLWCTFSEEQIDLNVESAGTRAFFKETLLNMCERGASIIRLDAFAYAVKKPDTSCFFVSPEIWNLLSWLEEIVKPYGVMILPEVHEHYTIQLDLAKRGYWIYDFALPMLLIHGLYAGESTALKQWLDISPQHQFTTLDTHDGIGVVDVKDLLTSEQVDFAREKLFSQGANVKKIYNTAAYNNLDIYQINSTYYAALGEEDNAYLLARAVQFFARGIPQVYYVGLLAGKNDIARMEATRNGRDINRHSYTLEEIAAEVERPVVKTLLAMMRFRNHHAAFATDGEFICQTPTPQELIITRRSGGSEAVLYANLKEHSFRITADGEEKICIGQT